MTASATPPKILVVEDDPHLLRLFMDALVGVGYDVTAADCVAAALAVAGTFDCLVLDLSLPDGTAADVRAHFPDVRGLTVSGRREADLQKPFAMDRLVAAVAARLADRRIWAD